eukprot:CFRG2498T1
MVVENMYNDYVDVLRYLSSRQLTNASNLLRTYHNEAKQKPNTGQRLQYLNIIQLIIGVETSYIRMTFLSRKNWSRNSMAIQLDRIRELLLKIESSSHSAASGPIDVTQKDVDNAVQHSAVTSLFAYVELRKSIMHMFHRLYAKNATLNVALCDSLLESAHLVHESMYLEVENDGLILATAQIDLKLLLELLRVYVNIEQYRFPEATIALHNAYNCRMTHSSPFSDHSNLHEWLEMLQDAFVAKYTVYFCRHLSNPLSDTAFRAIRARRKRDYLAIIHKLVRKTDCVNFSLIFVTSAALHTAGTRGFSLSPFSEPLTGMSAFPIIFSYPKPMPVKYKTNAIITLMERLPRLLGPSDGFSTSVGVGSSNNGIGGLAWVQQQLTPDWRKQNLSQVSIQQNQIAHRALASQSQTHKLTSDIQPTFVANKVSPAPVEFFRDDTNVQSSYYFVSVGENVVLVLISDTGRSSEDSSVSEQLRRFHKVMQYKDVMEEYVLVGK